MAYQSHVLDIESQESIKFTVLVLSITLLLGMVLGCCLATILKLRGEALQARGVEATEARTRGLRASGTKIEALVCPAFGQCFHFDRKCHGLRKAKRIEAYRPCKLCALGNVKHY